MKNIRFMKKSNSMFAAILIILLTTAAAKANAQFVNPETIPKPDSAQMHKKVLNHDSEMNYEKEILSEELPAAVSSAIEVANADHKIEKIYKIFDGSFEIELNKGDDRVTRYYNVNGELLGEEDYQDSDNDEQ